MKWTEGWWFSWTMKIYLILRIGECTLMTFPWQRSSKSPVSSLVLCSSLRWETSLDDAKLILFMLGCLRKYWSENENSHAYINRPCDQLWLSEPANDPLSLRRQHLSFSPSRLCSWIRCPIKIERKLQWRPTVLVESLENHISIVLHCLQLKTKEHQELDESDLFWYEHQSEECFFNFQLKQESTI